MAWEEFKDILREEYCPRNELQKLESELWNHKIVGSEIEEYTTQSHELARLYPHMVTPAFKRIELYIGGLVPQIKEMVTSFNPTTIQQAIHLAHQLTDQTFIQGALPKHANETRANQPPQQQPCKPTTSATTVQIRTCKEFQPTHTNRQNFGGLCWQKPQMQKVQLPQPWELQ